MSADDALLFIDANKYPDLYCTDSGRKLLAPLGEQVSYIFVTQQVVNEVQRNKIRVAEDFLSEKFKDLKLATFKVPDHLSGKSVGQGPDIQRQMGEIQDKMKALNLQISDIALSIMEQVSASEDEVSTALAPIFAQAVIHSPQELQRARDRRELGNPPGKSTDPIGDQLTWEQILTHFKGKKRLWIISKDSDYGTFYGGKSGKGFLNGFLYNELCEVASAPEIYLFTETVKGINHFVETTGVRAEQRLTPEESAEVEQEERALPRLYPTPDEWSQITASVQASMLTPEEWSRIAASVQASMLTPEERSRIAASVLEQYQRMKRYVI